MNTQNHLLTEKHQSIMLNILFQTTPHLMNAKSDQQLKSSQMDLDLPHTTISTSTASNDKLNEAMDVLLGSVQVLNDDTEKLNAATLRTQHSLQSVSEDLSKLKVAIEE